MLKPIFKAYFPDDGESPEDAIDVLGVNTPSHAADEACEYDYSARDGWERDMAGGSTKEFPIVIISPDGTEKRFVGWHEPSIQHRTEAVPDGK